MSNRRVDDVFGRALTDRRFRTQLLSDSHVALAGYELTEDERRHVASWTADVFEQLTRDLEVRVERARFDGVGFRPPDDSESASRAGLKAGPYEDAHRAKSPSAGRAGLKAGPYEGADRDLASLRSGRPLGRPDSPSAWFDDVAALAATLHQFQPSSREDASQAFDASARASREALLRESGILRQVAESVVQRGAVRLQCCSALYGGWYSDERFVLPGVCGGRGLDADVARARALSEAAERVAGAVYDDRTFVLDCYRHLAADAVPPSAFALFSPAQYAEPAFPYAPFTESTRINWTWGYSLLQQRRVLVPAQFVYRPYWPSGYETRIADLPTTGLACGRSLAEAVVNGLYEVIERDAIVIAWLNRLAVPRVGLDGSKWTTPTPACESGSAISLHDITTDLDIPARLALVVDRAHGIVSVGAAAHLDRGEAADKALGEALMIEPVVRSMMSRGPRPSAARREDVRTLEDHLLFYCHPQQLHELDFLLDVPESRSSDAETRSPRGPLEELRTVARSLRQHGLDAIVVDVTLPEIAEAGLCVVRTIVPGLIPLTFGQRFVAKGGERLYGVPVRLGHRDAPLREDELNTAPHPFA